MAIHFYPKVGGRVDFDTPEEAAAFFAITGGGTVEAPKQVHTTPAVTPAHVEHRGSKGQEKGGLRA